MKTTKEQAINDWVKGQEALAAAKDEWEEDAALKMIDKAGNDFQDALTV